MAVCRVCSNEYSDERAELGYDYCTDKKCVKECLASIEIVEVKQNKSNSGYVVRDREAEERMKNGSWQEQRKGATGYVGLPHSATSERVSRIPRRESNARVGPQPRKRLPGSQRQQRLVLVYHEMRNKPDEIASKVGLTRYEVSQIILATKKGTAL